MTPEEFIKAIRLLFGEYPDDSGGCKKFAELLARLYEGHLFYDSNHLITLIGERYYDIRGNYGPDDTVYYIMDGKLIISPISNFLPIEVFGKDHIKASFQGL